MPTYAYRCPGCGHEFETFQKITDDTRTKCPECGKRAERLISGGAGIVFKGSGFYETDYKRAGTTEKSDAKAGEGKSSTPDAGGDKSASTGGSGKKEKDS